ncbi:MAG: 30S ribosomal protein S9, partial [Candidatus Nanoarchaeia archaeon]
RLAIAKALVGFTGSKELRQKFLDYDRHLLVADTRRKEPRKWGTHSRARAKRQKSYR